VAELQYGRLPELERKLHEAQAKETAGIDKAAGARLLRTQVGAEEIAEVVSRATGIPVSKLVQGERDKLVHMEERLHRRVVGQDEAIRAVSDAIRRSRAGLSDPRRPYGSFLFLGPTGVGKTELTKGLAEFLFDTDEHIVRLDMSEFMEKHSVARSSARRQAMWAMTKAAISPKPCAASPTAWCCSTRWRKRIRTCSTCCCRCSTMAA
jgi:ATPases with chaperone activity, ATP-binding subunit